MYMASVATTTTAETSPPSEEWTIRQITIITFSMASQSQSWRNSSKLLTITRYSSSPVENRSKIPRMRTTGTCSPMPFVPPSSSSHSLSSSVWQTSLSSSSKCQSAWIRAQTTYCRWMLPPLSHTEVTISLKFWMVRFTDWFLQCFCMYTSCTSSETSSPLWCFSRGSSTPSVWWRHWPYIWSVELAVIFLVCCVHPRVWRWEHRLRFLELLES